MGEICEWQHPFFIHNPLKSYLLFCEVDCFVDKDNYYSCLAESPFARFTFRASHHTPTPTIKFTSFGPLCGLEN